jgi:NAD-dependent dihydropyrimidine dehydrogenase PreA subunit
MTHVIAAPCIDQRDQSCVTVCPVDCITADLGIDRKFYIDPEACIECGACESACPNEAVFRDDVLPASWKIFSWIDAVWYTDPAEARVEVDRQGGAIL